MKPQTVIDWSALIDDLRFKFRMTPTDVGKHAGVSRYSIYAYQYHGINPRHAEGERLIELWCVLTKQDRLQAPMKPEQLSAAKVARL